METLCDRINFLWKSGKSYKEICEELGLTKNCVAYNLSLRGRKSNERKKAAEIVENEFKENVIRILPECNSINDVCKKLELKGVDGYYKKVKKVIDENKLDVSHFGTKTTSKGCFEKMSDEEYFCECKARNGVNMLKRLIADNKKERKCEKCGLKFWEGCEIPLQIHHINGKHDDNRLENLQVLCPNCHALTDNFCKKKESKSKVINKTSVKIEKIVDIESQKETLLRLFERYKTFVKVAKIIGISDNGVRKRCKKLGILDDVLKMK